VTVRLNPHLSFRDDAREAMTSYQSVLGGELTISTFGDLQPVDDPAVDDKVMHAQLETPDGLVLMAADTPPGMEHRPQAGVSVALTGDDEAKLRGFWDRLSEGGNVLVPFQPAPWGATFGMCIDRFGTTWMLNLAP
jgi:PhnB protein